MTNCVIKSRLIRTS